MPKEKRCSVCNESKTEEHFHPSIWKVSREGGKCKVCSNAYNKQYEFGKIRTWCGLHNDITGFSIGK